MPDRRETLDAFVEGYAAPALETAIDFDEHRYVAVEISTKTKQGHYITGHRTIRDACDYLSAVDPPYVPHEIIDLDTQRRIEIEHHYVVTPRDEHAVMLVMPRILLRALWADLQAEYPGRNAQTRERVLRYVNRVLVRAR